jgi:sulfatase maturation enzyme AslB (radical SAM superfamily)
MEYANTKLFTLKKDYKVDQKKVEQEIEQYKKTGRLSLILVDNDYAIVDNAEAFLAGKKLGLKYLESAREKSKIKPDTRFPSAFLLELTNKCNLFCRMCPRNQMSREIKDMEFDVFKKVVDEMAQHKIEGLWLYNIGESLLHPHFFEMLEYAGKYENLHPLWLSTNGVKMTEENSAKILNSKLDFFNISLNALDENTHKKIARKPNFQLIMDNIENLLKMKKKLGTKKPYIRVQVIDMPEMHDQIERFTKEWGPKADIISVNKLEEFSGQKEIPSNKGINQSGKITTPCRRIDRGFLYIFADN